MVLVSKVVLNKGCLMLLVAVCIMIGMLFNIKGGFYN